MNQSFNRQQLIRQINNINGRELKLISIAGKKELIVSIFGIGLMKNYQMESPNMLSNFRQ